MKKWIKINLSIVLLILFTIGLINLWMDPFWCFNHNHKYNSIQKGINERQQKANYIYFNTKEFDTLLLGSSRTTYMDKNAFKNMSVFNFSAPGMRPHEYDTYIDFVLNDTNKEINNIIIGMDFFGYLSYGLFMFNEANSVVQTTKTPFYKYKMLVSFDALNNSIKNIRDNLKNRLDDRYNRDLVKRRNFSIHSKEMIMKDIEIYSKTEYSSQPNPNYFNIVSNIKTKYNKKFIVYTTPVSTPLFSKLIEMGHYNNYENWLRTLVDVYGNVFHFMYINDITNDYLNTFADSNHAYTKTYTLIANKITNQVEKDFGILLTKENIEEKLQELRALNLR